jgi:ATP-dependent DNA helicase DinG
VLFGAGDAIISDELNHASIIDGVRLSKAMRYRYKNADMADLRSQLEAAREAGAQRVVVVTDGVFSMDGSYAPLDEICDLVDALDGRTLGLFSSRRAAETAAEAVRAKLPHLTTLAQGDAQLPELAKQFVEDPHTCLFGTLSLWQGLDVPGDTCQLVIIDRIPFPRPDEPLTVARQRAVADAGGNGFMAVAASHAALLLAQGSGRLIRRVSDRGVVAVLDPRLVTARYGSYLRSSMPPMWTTSDRETAIGALRRLAETS